MYVDTIFGIKWRDAASSIEVIVILAVIILAIAAYSLYKYNLKLEQKIQQARLLFQFKIKQYGLTGLQSRIVNHIIEKRKLKDPEIIFDSPDLFEASIGEMLDYLKSCTEDGESLGNICKDLIITYEKLYHHKTARKPIEKISDIEEGVLLYFYLDTSSVFVGKIIENSDTNILLQLFRNIKNLPELKFGKTYEFYLWRSGDAEYIFKAKVVSYDNGRVIIDAPSEFTRGKEVRKPYIDVSIPCELYLPEELKVEGESYESVTGIIHKLNEYEVVIRLAQKLDYRINYVFNFELDEFKVNTSIHLMSDKTISEGDVHYYTCKILDISDAARLILRKFINNSF